MSPGSRPKKRLCVSLLTAGSFSKGCYPAKAGSEKERSGFSLSPDGVEGRILRIIRMEIKVDYWLMI